MIKDFVTILTPAYNAEHLIFRLLNSVLEQTYDKISMIVVNDGSTDNTIDVVKSYATKFEKRGYYLKIISQKNSGQASAINNGLKHVDGEYLVWPDSDDWYASPKAIEKLVNALKRYGDDVGVSRCAYNRVMENSMETIKVTYPHMGKEPKNIFDETIKGSPIFWFEPGGWMVKTKFLDDIIPGREIYCSPLTGQNTQLLWPYLFYKKCIAIEEPLFSYLIRENSHSRGFFKDLNKKLVQQDEIYKTYNTVISSLHGLDENKKIEYLNLKKSDILINKINICRNFRDYKKMSYFYKIYIEKCNSGEIINNVPQRDKFIYTLYRIPILRNFVDILLRVFKAFRRVL